MPGEGICESIQVLETNSLCIFRPESEEGNIDRRIDKFKEAAGCKAGKLMCRNQA
jgi:hypothetical protein